MDEDAAQLFAYRLELAQDRLYLLNTLLEEDRFQEKEIRLAALEAFHQAVTLLQQMAEQILDAYSSTAKDAAYNFNRLKELDVLSYTLKERMEQAFATDRELREEFPEMGVTEQRVEIKDLTPALLAVANRFEEWVMNELEHEESE